MKQLIVIFLFLNFCVTTGFAQIAIIAHKSGEVDRIEKSQLLDFYTGDKNFWKNGEPVIIFDLKTKDEVRDVFYSFLGISSTRIKSIWMKRMLSGDADPPEFLVSEEEMLKKVASTPGAIGFISQSKVNGQVKILAIINENTQ